MTPLAVIVILAAIGVMLESMHRGAVARRADARIHAAIVMAPETEHVRVWWSPPPSFVYDWGREPDLRGPAVVDQPRDHAAA